MEILPLPALFRFLRHFKQYTGLSFRMPGIENRASGDQQIGARLHHRGDGIVGDAPIDLNSEVRSISARKFYQAPDLVQGEADEFLPAKTRIDAHHQHVVNHGQNFDQKIDPGSRVNDHCRFHAMLRDQFQGAVQVAAGLVVHANPVRSSGREFLNKVVRIFDH